MSSILNDSASPALTAPLSDATLDSLQLHSQPFRAASEEDALYVDEATDAALGELRDAILESDDLLLVVGPEGAGKTSLLQLLDRESDAHGGPSIQCFMVHGSERFNTQNLFAGMLEAFGREVPEELQDILDELVQCLSDVDANEIVCAIVVDDAAHIPAAELTRLLSAGMYINTSNRALLHTVLAADESFEARIPDLLPGGADLPYAALQLAAMDDARAADFLGFRLQEAGLPGELPFTLDEVADLNAHAEGLPGAVQVAAARVLNEQHGPLPVAPSAQVAAVAAPLKMRLHRTPKLLLGAVAVALIAAGLFLFLPSPEQSASDRYTVTETRKIDTSDDSPGASAGDEDVNSVTTAGAALDSSSTSDDLSAAADAALDAGSPDRQLPNAPEPGASLPGAPPADVTDTTTASAPGSDGEPVTTADAEPAADAAGRQIVSVDFRRGAQGEGLLAVSLTGAEGAVDTRQQGDQYIVAFPATGIADNLQGRRDVGDFDTPVDVVDIMSTGDRVLLIVQIGSDDFKDSASFEDNTLTIAFTPTTGGSVTENTTAGTDAESSVTQNDIVTESAQTDPVNPQADSVADSEAESVAESVAESLADSEAAPQATADSATSTPETNSDDSAAPAVAATDSDVDIAAASDNTDAVQTANNDSQNNTGDVTANSGGNIAGDDATTTLESPNWVLVQNPAQYTVQMIAARDPDSVEAFLQDHNLEGPNSVFSFELRGETWHAMVHGLFPSIESAQAAIQRLPPEAQVNQPWIRSISRLQNTLRDQEQ